MNALSKVLEFLKDFITAIFALVSNVLSGIGQMVMMIPQALLMLTRTLGFMPTVCLAFAMALVMINIVYLVVDR